MIKRALISVFVLAICLSITAQYSKEELSLSIRQINEKYYKGANFYVGVAPGSSYLNKINKEKLDFIMDEFKHITSSAFKQTYVLPEPSAPWNDQEYKHRNDPVYLAIKRAMLKHAPINNKQNVKQEFHERRGAHGLETFP